MSTVSLSPGKCLRASTVVLLCAFLLSCAGAATNKEAEWPPLAKKWYDRATASLHVGDIQDAELAVENAIRLEPKRTEVRLVAARVALAQLQYDRVIQLTDTMAEPEALSLRGRAFWYAGRVQDAAETLEHLVANPDVHDSWAVDIAKLARRGVGRKPFTMTGAMVAVVDMPRVGRSLLAPVEVDGEPALGMIATGVSETVIDASSGTGPKWISLRFGERIEVKDVPALAKDLSSLSRQLNAPIKIMLGVNLLRHLRPTIDLYGGQFVVRNFEPPPPPLATTIPVAYVRGGGMLIRGGFGPGDSTEPGSVMIDSSMDVPLAVDAGGWKKAGKSPSDLQPLAGSRGMTQGVVPVFGFGTLEIPEVPAVGGMPIQEIEKPIDMDLDGIIGAGLLGPFRVSLVDGGRAMWLEPRPVDPEAQAAAAEAAAATPPVSPQPPPAVSAPSKPTPPASTPSGASPASPSLNAPLGR